MKKIVLTFILFVLFISSNLLAFEHDLFKVDEKDWEVEKQSNKITLFFLNKSIPIFIDVLGKDLLQKDLRPYFIVKINELSEPTEADFSKKGLEEFKNKFENNEFKRFAERYKNSVRKDFISSHPKIDKNKAEEIIKEAIGEIKITSSSVEKLGDYQAYVFEYQMGPVNSKHYIIPTLNYQYYVILEYYSLIEIDKIQQCTNFLKSFVVKDKAPTKMNVFLYGSGLKILLAVLLVLSLIIFKLVNRNMR